jgi:hypothetical protein
LATKASNTDPMRVWVDERDNAVSTKKNAESQWGRRIFLVAGA